PVRPAGRPGHVPGPRLTPRRAPTGAGRPDARPTGDPAWQTPAMELDQIAYEVADGVATITLDRPDRMNAFTIPMQRQLVEAFDRVDADDDVRAVIVTGRARAFCAGADLGAGADSFDADVHATRAGA